MGNKIDEYEKAITDLGQIICLDKDLNQAEVVVLMDLMKACGETAIKMIAGESKKRVLKILKQGCK